MTHVHERVFVNCSYARVRGYLREAIRPSATDGLPRVAPLRVAGFSKNIVLDYALVQDELRSRECVHIHWEPEGGGPYPSFDGTLVACAVAGGAVVEIHGEYAPPFGAFGKAFDLAVGQTIAMCTVRTLLERFAEAMQQAFLLRDGGTLNDDACF